MGRPPLAVSPHNIQRRYYPRSGCHIRSERATRSPGAQGVRRVIPSNEVAIILGLVDPRGMV